MRIVCALLVLLLTLHPAYGEPLLTKDVFDHNGGLNSYEVDTALNETESPSMDNCRIYAGAITKRGGWDENDVDTDVSLSTWNTRDYYHLDWWQTNTPTYGSQDMLISMYLQQFQVSDTTVVTGFKMQFENTTTYDTVCTFEGDLVQNDNLSNFWYNGHAGSPTWASKRYATSGDVTVTLDAGATVEVTFTFSSSYTVSPNTTYVIGAVRNRFTDFSTENHPPVSPLLGSSYGNGTGYYKAYFSLYAAPYSYQALTDIGDLWFEVTGTSNTKGADYYERGDTLAVTDYTREQVSLHFMYGTRWNQTFSVSQDMEVESFIMNIYLASSATVNASFYGYLYDDTGTVLASMDQFFYLYPETSTDVTLTYDIPYTITAGETYAIEAYCVSSLASGSLLRTSYDDGVGKSRYQDATDGWEDWVTEGDFWFKINPVAGESALFPEYTNGHMFLLQDTDNIETLLYLALDGEIYTWPPLFETTLIKVTDKYSFTGYEYDYATANVGWDYDQGFIIVNGVDVNSKFIQGGATVRASYLPRPAFQATDDEIWIVSYDVGGQLPPGYYGFAYMYNNGVGVSEAVHDWSNVGVLGGDDNNEYSMFVYELHDAYGIREDVNVDIYRTLTCTSSVQAMNSELYHVKTIPNINAPAVNYQVVTVDGSEGLDLARPIPEGWEEEAVQVNPCVCIEEFNNRCFYGGPTDHPNWIYFSEYDNFGKVRPLDYVIFEKPITAMGALLNKIVVFAKEEIHNFTFLTRDNYIKKIMFTDVGCVSKGSVQTLHGGTSLIFLSYKGIMEYDGVRLGKLSFRVQDYIDRINWSATQQIDSFNYVLRNEYWLSLPLDGATTNNTTLVYNYEDDFWYVIEDGYFGFNYYVKDSKEISVMYALSDTQVQRREYSIEDTEIFSDGGTAIEMEYTSNWETFGTEGYTKNIDFIKLVTQAELDTTMTVYYGYDYDESFDWGVTLTVTSSTPEVHKLKINRECDAMRLKFWHGENDKRVSILGWTYYYRTGSAR
jgi:hypothetical protein